MCLDKSKRNIDFQIVAKLDVDNKTPGVRLKKITVEEKPIKEEEISSQKKAQGAAEEYAIRATLMANNTDEYSNIRKELDHSNLAQKITVKGAGKGLYIIARGEACSDTLIMEFSKIRNFEQESLKFANFLCELLEISQNPETLDAWGLDHIEIRIKSISLVDGLATVSLEAKTPQDIDKEDFFNKFSGLKLDYEFGIVK